MRQASGAPQISRGADLHVETGPWKATRAHQPHNRPAVQRGSDAAGWRILVEGEESVVSFLRAEGETDSGIEAILEHPGPDWYAGVWLDERRGYEGQMRTVSDRDGVDRIESGPEDDFWAVIDAPDDEDDEF